MPRFIFKNLPQGISETRRIAIENHLSKLKVYQETDIVHLSYIGGITNHGFKDEERSFFIRVPGLQSHILVDRKSELLTIQQIQRIGLYYPLIEEYGEGELAGYKVELFIEGDTLQFNDFHTHQENVMPLLKSLHDTRIRLPNTFNIFDKLNIMSETLYEVGVEHIPFLLDGCIELIPIAEVNEYIFTLQRCKDKLFPYLDTTDYLYPCHNDITPSNFIKRALPLNGQDYQMLDFEYAGMNDNMYDLAIIAAMQALNPEQQAKLVLQYFQCDDEKNAPYDEEIKRVQFYSPIVKLYYSLWSTLQVHMGNESQEVTQLLSGWGPESLTRFIEQFESEHYQSLLEIEANEYSFK